MFIYMNPVTYLLIVTSSPIRFFLPLIKIFSNLLKAQGLGALALITGPLCISDQIKQVLEKTGEGRALQCMPSPLLLHASMELESCCSIAAAGFSPTHLVFNSLPRRGVVRAVHWI
jgi:hypothetical protein